jgi:hypothetical protein
MDECDAVCKLAAVAGTSVDRERGERLCASVVGKGAARVKQGGATRTTS